MNRKLILYPLILLMALSMPVYAGAEPPAEPNPAGSGVAAAEAAPVRTTFQTGAGGAYENAHVLADSVMAYIGNPASIESHIASWTNRGYQVDAMLAVNRDMNDYVRGNFDGKTHYDEIQVDRDGNRFTHPTDVNVPYMVPTENWNKYVYELSRRTIEAGAKRIVFEEPDVFLKSGYSDAFKREWKSFYGSDWIDPVSSKDAGYMSQKLKVYLSYRAFKDISEKIKSNYPDVEVLIASHTALSYLMYGITTSNYDYYNIPTIDGYIAQVWSDTALVPVPYAGTSQRRVFESAYIDYSSFANLKLGNDGKQLYALADPKADSGTYSWPEYEAFYKTTIAAQLMQPQFKQFEVVPWSERGFAQAPGPYKTVQTNVYRALQDMYDKPATVEAGTPGIGVLYSDTISQMATSGDINAFYGTTVPLVAKGVPIQVIPAENLTKPNALADMNVLFVSYDVWKAVDGNGGGGIGVKVNEALRDWVSQGGVLVYTGGAGSSDDLSEWWSEADLSSPKRDLWNKLGLAVSGEATTTGSGTVTLRAAGAGNGVFGGRGTIDVPAKFAVTAGTLASPAVPLYTTADGKAVVYEQPIGSGKAIVAGVAPGYFASSAMAAQVLRDIAKYAVEQTGATYAEANVMKSIRGPYTAIQTLEEPARIELQSSSYIDLFDDRLPVVTGETEMMAQSSALLYDVTGRTSGDKPAILFASGNLTGVSESAAETLYTLAGTPNSRAAARIGAPQGLYPQAIEGTDSGGAPVTVSWEWENRSNTLLVRHDHRKQGVTIRVQWSETPVADSPAVDFAELNVKTNNENLDAAYLWRNTGGAIDAFRFADTTAEIVYKFDLNRYANARISLDVANNYVLSVSPDEAAWTPLYTADSSGGVITDGSNRAIKTIDLSAYKGADDFVYIKMENADKTRGNGPVLYGFNLGFEQRIAPFGVRTNETLDLVPGQTRMLKLAVTNRLSEVKTVDMSIGRSTYNALSFTAGSAAEADYLFENEGSQLAGNGGRYADLANYFVYKLPVPADMQAPVAKLTLANRYQVSLSRDGDDWTIVDSEMAAAEGENNLGERSYELGEYTNDGGYVYVKIANSQPSGGWGGMLKKLTLQAKGEGELEVAFPNDGIELQPHQTRLIEVAVTAKSGIQSALPQQSIRLSAGGDFTDYELPVKINFIKPEYPATWAASPIAIDGRADESEWSGARTITVSSSDPDLLRFGKVWGEAGNVKATYRLKWDDANLYVLEQREDSAFAFTETGATMYASTASMLFLDMDRGKSGSAYLDGDYAIFFTPSGPDDKPHVFMRQGADGGKEEYALDSAKINSNVEMAAHTYTVELAIPWSALQIMPFAPKNGTKVGMTVAATRNAGNGVWGQLMWSGDGDDQAKWSDMLLTGKPEDSGNPGNPGNPGGGWYPSVPSVDDGDEPDDWNNGGGGEVLSVKIADDADEVSIFAEQLGGRPLDVQAGDGASLRIGGELLRKLLAQAGDKKGTTIVVHMARVAKDSLLAPKRQGESANIRLAGQAYDISIRAVTPDGKTYEVMATEGGATVTLPFDPEAVEGKLLGVYRYDETGKTWEYVGGRTDAKAHRISVKLKHLGLYAAIEYDKRFGDVPAGHWAYDAIRTLAAKHIASGVGANGFQPAGTVTRAEFVALLVRALGLEASGKQSELPFADIESGAWYAANAAAAYEAGLVKGDSEGAFRPGERITREQMAVLLVRAYELGLGRAVDAPADDETPYVDGAVIAAWARADVSKAHSLALMKGQGANRFAPQSTATRAESAQAVLNLLERLEERPAS
ncbi:S-layer homology domain-containing protein [Paenibacillus spongiae]|uniref:S-layer homology domain-containing protein n=1 Tax=Paenibacillus spongiae TaxID=2909671 RepID=A0ABY5SCY9_9BACL|nr:S-layer homology domain-containing protein [Paenibacillus spongiae]UVI31809.1 S-layer homology domain-containing protein [Paenibacillus spongiae]